MVESKSDRSHSSSDSGSSKRASRARSSDSYARQDETHRRYDNYKPQSTKCRERAVYIKMRPAFGLDMDFSEILDAFKKKNDPNRESSKEPSKERFRPLHWAVEIGPWTIELAKDPSKPGRVCMTSTHVREWDSSWEKETSRMKVGTTFFSDRRLCRPGTILEDEMQPYHLFSSNCQNAAAKFAIAVCKDRPGAYDEIFLSPYRRTAFLTMEEPLEYLMELEGWDQSDPEFLIRFVPVVVRSSSFNQTRNDQGTGLSKTSENIYLRRLARKYLGFERKMYASLTGKQVGDFQYDEDRQQDDILFAKSAYWYKQFFNREDDTQKSKER